MFKTILRKIADILLMPFRKHFLFLIAFFILATTPYILEQVVPFDNYIYALYLTTHCFLISYLLTLVIAIIQPHIIRRLVKVVLVVISAIWFALNIYCLFELGGLIDVDYLMLVLGTNPQESKEFLTVMLPIKIVLGVSATFLFLILLYTLFRHKNLTLGKSSRIFIYGLVCMCIAANIYNWKVWQHGPIKHYIDLLNNYSQYEIPDYTQLKHTLPLVEINELENIPTNVVLIIGESFARYHSSLYDYDKVTNPLLGELKKSSLLFTFDSINTPAPTTSLALEYILSIFSKSDTKNKEKKWFEYLTIIDLMKACGFDCYWYSNQAKAGQFNYIARVIAETCNENHFYQKEGPISNNLQFDYVLVDSTCKSVEIMNQSKHHFIIYHMMGSHFDYERRYPAEFAKYTEKDYNSYPQHQRDIRASYDNSILYNDYVVEQIMNLFRQSETLVIYLPDHGLDFYRSSSDYHAHGKMNDTVSLAYGIQIPFFVYASPLYQQKHPETMERIINRQNNPISWNSDDLPYFIMDLIGIKEINGEDVRAKSAI